MPSATTAKKSVFLVCVWTVWYCGTQYSPTLKTCTDDNHPDDVITYFVIPEWGRLKLSEKCVCKQNWFIYQLINFTCDQTKIKVRPADWLLNWLLCKCILSNWKKALFLMTQGGLTKTSFLKNVKSIWLSHCGMKFRGLMQKITLPISLL